MQQPESPQGSSVDADKTPTKDNPHPQAVLHRRTSSGGGLLSKLPFMRSAPADTKQRLDSSQPGDAERLHPPPSNAMSTLVQQQKTRRRRGSLRKVALLGRGAQRERRDAKPLTIDTMQAAALDADAIPAVDKPAPAEPDGLGIVNTDLTPRPSMDGFASRSSLVSSSISSTSPPQTADGGEATTDRRASYNSTTTDEEDMLQMPTLGSGTGSLSSGSESYFGNRAALQPLRRRSVLQAKSPLSYTGLASTPMPAAEADFDYSETEWWGWVILVVTWVVFVTGMGSCLGIWSWAWDVGTTPYAPPELEDDPTLPIVGYYPALIILTCIMAWIWVVVAWVGMKYFRHAKLSGD